MGLDGKQLDTDSGGTRPDPPEVFVNEPIFQPPAPTVGNSAINQNQGSGNDSTISSGAKSSAKLGSGSGTESSLLTAKATENSSLADSLRSVLYGIGSGAESSAKSIYGSIKENTEKMAKQGVLPMLGFNLAEDMKNNSQENTQNKTKDGPARLGSKDEIGANSKTPNEPARLGPENEISPEDGQNNSKNKNSNSPARLGPKDEIKTENGNDSGQNKRPEPARLGPEHEEKQKAEEIPAPTPLPEQIAAPRELGKQVPFSIDGKKGSIEYDKKTNEPTRVNMPDGSSYTRVGDKWEHRDAHGNKVEADFKGAISITENGSLKVARENGITEFHKKDGTKIITDDNKWSQTKIDKNGNKSTKYWDEDDKGYTREARKNSLGQDDVKQNADGSYTVNFVPKDGHASSMTRDRNKNEVTTDYGTHSVKTNWNSLKSELTTSDGKTTTYFHDGVGWRQPASVKQEGDKLLVSFGDDSGTSQMKVDTKTGKSEYKYKDGREVSYSGYKGSWNVEKFKQGKTELDYKYDSAGQLTEITSSDLRTVLRRDPLGENGIPTYSGKLDGKKVDKLPGNLVQKDDGELQQGQGDKKKPVYRAAPAAAPQILPESNSARRQPGQQSPYYQRPIPSNLSYQPGRGC